MAPIPTCSSRAPRVSIATALCASRLAGGVNLRLLRGFLPELQAQGRADANVSIEGTMSQPRVTGRATVRDASANYADFPIGLSKVNGDMLFDKNRLVFDRLTAESGGGQLVLGGSLNYGEGPLSYEVSATTAMVRIRYPMGMSWLAGGNLQLSGTRTAALLSGRVQVQRLLFAEGRRRGLLFRCLHRRRLPRKSRPVQLFSRTSPSISRARPIPAPASNGRALKSKWMEMCACAARGPARSCSGIFI